MYNDYFGLREAPFSIAPNPYYLFMSSRHREALAHLMYGIQSDGGFILLTGEVGTGKTTVCRCLLEQIPQDVDTAYILNPKLTAQELLATACDELKIEYPKDASIKVLVDQLNAFLLESHQEGRRTVLIIDEAQNLSVDVLEQLRLLTNLETNQRKLLQIILLGQPELLTVLAKQELRQLSQRVTARFHLDALNKDEVSEYIQHRLDTAGAKGTLFPASAVKRIYQISNGIPRLINLVCDRALLGTYVQNRLQVDVATINNAAKEILGSTPKSTTSWLGIAAALILTVGLGFAFFAMQKPPAPENELVVGVEPSADREPSPGRNPSSSSESNLTTDSLLNSESNTTERMESPLIADSTSTPEAINNNSTSETQPALISASMQRLNATDEVNQAFDLNPGDTVIVPPSTQNIARPTSLADIIGYDTQAEAFSTLFQLWNVDIEKHSNPRVDSNPPLNPCDLAAASGLLCLSKLGSLRDVAHLNRPVVLSLSSGTNNSNQWFVASSMTGNAVTLTAKNLSYEISTEQLLSAWSGYYTLAWRSPPAYNQPAKRGDRGPTVDWLQTQLAFVEGSISPSLLEGTTFDSTLEERVKRFQIAVGLIPDGIVGPQTWIHLNSADDSSIPKLGN